MKNLVSLLLIATASQLMGQTSQDYVVSLQAKAVESSTSIELTWETTASANGYSVFRKSPEDIYFGSALAILGNVGEYTDNDVNEGEEYEYYVRMNATSYSGYGYTHSGINVEHSVERGDALLIVESSINSALSSEVDMTEQDILADGWNVHRLVVDADTTVEYVKELIEEADDDLNHLELVYLVGHVPVPYSGNLAPDAHSNHIGAWPADVFYAELNGNWTDNAVANTSASDSRNHNIPGDGKFDQSQIPNTAELMIGRVDFANMPSFSQDEIELTRRYLERVHNYKRAKWTLPHRAIIDDNFGGFNGEAFAANGYRNFSPLVGRDSISPSDYRSTLDSAGHLFSYGCGGGSFTSANGIGTTAQLATDSLLTGFTMLFGSYFGDWDRPDNFLRAALAQGRTMSISWAGRPHWHYQSFGLGYPLGYSARLTQNNEGAYFYSYGDQFVHIALLGDPTLRMEYVAPPTDLSIQSIDTFDIQVSWTASTDNQVEGYNIYTKNVLDQWVQVNENLITGTEFIDSCVIDLGARHYAVKAVKNLDNYSGSYWNTSLAIEDSIIITVDKYASGVGYFFEDHSTDPVSGTFYVSEVSDYTTSIRWIAEGNTFYGDTVSYTTSLSPNDLFTYGVRFSNRCSSVTESIAINLTNVEDLGSISFSLFPNPAISGSTIFIDLDEGLQGIQLFSMDGNLVSELAFNQNFVQLPKLACGVYIIKATTADREIFERLIVQ